MKRLLPIAAVVCALTLTGCMSSRQYSSYIKIGNTEFGLPKDCKFGSLTAKVPVLMGTNGELAYASVCITNGEFKMNPQVIDAATAHDVAIINSVGNLAGTINEKTLKGAAEGLK